MISMNHRVKPCPRRAASWRPRGARAVFLVLALAGGLAADGHAGDPAPLTGSITVTITGFRNTRGQLLINLFNSAKGFPDKPGQAFRAAEASPVKDPMTVVFDGVPPGEYAIALVHDEDMNGNLTTSFWGYPREGLGASNNNLPQKGKPRFSDSKFPLDEGKLAVNVRLRYY